jgi:predicted membrane channel-forming protein YqfA (hemolysin III family)
MARHRIGDSYLSDKELEEHNLGKWLISLFLIGAAIGGATAHEFLKSFDLPKWVLFVLVTVSGIGFGTILTFFQRFIRMALSIVFCCTIIYLIGLGIWRLI